MYRISLLLVDYVHRVTDVWTLQRFVSEAGSVFGFRQEAPNLLDPIDQDPFDQAWFYGTNRFDGSGLKTEAEKASET
jgi:hypothetical protein